MCEFNIIFFCYRYSLVLLIYIYITSLNVFSKLLDLYFFSISGLVLIDSFSILNIVPSATIYYLGLASLAYTPFFVNLNMLKTRSITLFLLYAWYLHFTSSYTGIFYPDLVSFRNQLLSNTINYIHPFLVQGVLVATYILLFLLFKASGLSRYLVNFSVSEYMKIWSTFKLLISQLSISLILGMFWSNQIETWRGWWVWDYSEVLLLLLFIVYLSLYHMRFSIQGLVYFLERLAGYTLFNAMLVTVTGNLNSLHSFFINYDRLLEEGIGGLVLFYSLLLGSARVAKITSIAYLITCTLVSTSTIFMLMLITLFKSYLISTPGLVFILFLLQYTFVMRCRVNIQHTAHLYYITLLFWIYFENLSFNKDALSHAFIKYNGFLVKTNRISFLSTVRDFKYSLYEAQSFLFIRNFNDNIFYYFGYRPEALINFVSNLTISCGYFYFIL